MEKFIPVSALIGGALIGRAAAVLLWFNGRVAGISGIFNGLLHPQAGETAWRAPLYPAPGFLDLAAGIGGFPVGFGTRTP